MKYKLSTGVAPVFAMGAIAAITFLSGSARADTFDTTLASPDSNPATADTGATSNPSWYNGSGNPQGGWTTDTANGIEVGLRAKIRGGAEIDTPTDTYYVPPGSGGSPLGALWNYEFSIDLNPGGGVPPYTLANILADTTLEIKDLTNPSTVIIDPLTFWTDNTKFGSPGSTSTQTDKHGGAILATDYGVQNSENLLFGNPGFDTNAPDVYQFTLTVRDSPTHVLASTEMKVNVTPEPSAIILMSILALPLFFLARRKKNASLR